MGTMILIGFKILIFKFFILEIVFDVFVYRLFVSIDRYREVKINEDQCGRVYLFYLGGRIDLLVSLVVLGFCVIGLRGLG